MKSKRVFFFPAWLPIAVPRLFLFPHLFLFLIEHRGQYFLFLLPTSPLYQLQVFSMFLETLVDFIQVHKDDLQDWLFVLLTQLLKKMGADLLGSVQAKVQKALDVTR